MFGHRTSTQATQSSAHSNKIENASRSAPTWGHPQHREQNTFSSNRSEGEEYLLTPIKVNTTNLILNVMATLKTHFKSLIYWKNVSDSQ